jgi:acyl carrier protein
LPRHRTDSTGRTAKEDDVTRDALHRRLAELVCAASDGEITWRQAAATPSLTMIGVASLEMLRLIDAVEDEFGVPLAIDDEAGFLDTVDGIAAHLIAQGLPVEG